MADNELTIEIIAQVDKAIADLGRVRSAIKSTASAGTSGAGFSNLKIPADVPKSYGETASQAREVREALHVLRLPLNELGIPIRGLREVSLLAGQGLTTLGAVLAGTALAVGIKKIYEFSEANRLAQEQLESFVGSGDGAKEAYQAIAAGATRTHAVTKDLIPSYEDLSTAVAKYNQQQEGFGEQFDKFDSTQIVGAITAVRSAISNTGVGFAEAQKQSDEFFKGLSEKGKGSAELFEKSSVQIQNLIAKALKLPEGAQGRATARQLFEGLPAPLLLQRLQPLEGQIQAQEARRIPEGFLEQTGIAPLGHLISNAYTGGLTTEDERQQRARELQTGTDVSINSIGSLFDAFTKYYSGQGVGAQETRTREARKELAQARPTFASVLPQGITSHGRQFSAADLERISQQPEADQAKQSQYVREQIAGVQRQQREYDERRPKAQATVDAADAKTAAEDKAAAEKQVAAAEKQNAAADKAQTNVSEAASKLAAEAKPGSQEQRFFQAKALEEPLAAASDRVKLFGKQLEASQSVLEASFGPAQAHQQVEHDRLTQDQLKLEAESIRLSQEALPIKENELAVSQEGQQFQAEQTQKQIDKLKAQGAEEAGSPLHDQLRGLLIKQDEQQVQAQKLAQEPAHLQLEAEQDAQKLRENQLKQTDSSYKLAIDQHHEVISNDLALVKGTQTMIDLLQAIVKNTEEHTGEAGAGSADKVIDAIKNIKIDLPAAQDALNAISRYLPQDNSKLNTAVESLTGVLGNLKKIGVGGESQQPASAAPTPPPEGIHPLKPNEAFGRDQGGHVVPVPAKSPGAVGTEFTPTGELIRDPAAVQRRIQQAEKEAKQAQQKKEEPQHTGNFSTISLEELKSLQPGAPKKGAEGLDQAASAQVSAAKELQGAGTELKDAAARLKGTPRQEQPQSSQPSAPTPQAQDTTDRYRPPTQQQRSGGLIRFLEGGLIVGAGTGTSDSIPAMLEPGGFVLRASSTAAIGKHALDSIRMSDGGKVPAMVSHGEYYFKPSDVDKIGVNTLHAMNSMGVGGIVSFFVSGGVSNADDKKKENYKRWLASLGKTDAQLIEEQRSGVQQRPSLPVGGGPTYQYNPNQGTVIVPEGKTLETPPAARASAQVPVADTSTKQGSGSYTYTRNDSGDVVIVPPDGMREGGFAIAKLAEGGLFDPVPGGAKSLFDVNRTQTDNPKDSYTIEKAIGGQVLNRLATGGNPLISPVPGGANSLFDINRTQTDDPKDSYTIEKHANKKASGGHILDHLVKHFDAGGFVSSGFVGQGNQLRGSISVGGAQASAVLDTGATETAVSEDVIKNSNIDPSQAQAGSSRTASGSIDTKRISAPVTVAGVTENVEVDIFPSGALPTSLLGFNWLNALSDYAITKSSGLLIKAASGGEIMPLVRKSFAGGGFSAVSGGSAWSGSGGFGSGIGGAIGYSFNTSGNLVQGAGPQAPLGFAFGPGQATNFPSYSSQNYSGFPLSLLSPFTINSSFSNIRSYPAYNKLGGLIRKFAEGGDVSEISYRKDTGRKPTFAFEGLTHLFEEGGAINLPSLDVTASAATPSEIPEAVGYVGGGEVAGNAQARIASPPQQIGTLVLSIGGSKYPVQVEQPVAEQMRKDSVNWQTDRGQILPDWYS